MRPTVPELTPEFAANNDADQKIPSDENSWALHTVSTTLVRRGLTGIKSTSCSLPHAYFGKSANAIAGLRVLAAGSHSQLGPSSGSILPAVRLGHPFPRYDCGDMSETSGIARSTVTKSQFSVDLEL